MEKILFNETSADVHFIVGDPEKGNVERIPAIVAILCTASDVFKAMFLGNFERPTEVDVPDADPETFKIILRYIYTDEILLNLEDAVDILYVAKKYMLQPLVDRTARYISGHMTPENVCLFLEYADVLDDIKERCWDVIDSETTDVIYSEAFLKISPQQLSVIAKRNTLCVEEIELYERVIEWAKAQLRKGDLEPTPKAIRGVLGDALFGIRFPVMDRKQFTSEMAKSRLLSAKAEALEVFVWYSNGEKPKSFASEGRAHGRIRLKLDLRALVDGSLASPHDSAAHQIGDATWSIHCLLAQRPQREQNEPVKFELGFFLKCHGPPANRDWRCAAYALMRVVAQAPDVYDICRTTGHTFTPADTDWGSSQFAQCDRLLDANNGFLLDDKYVELTIDVFSRDCAPPTIVALCAAARFD
ncbi:BTB/POZ domain-containing protein 6 [Aphelenchoides avenae]|nr:BTB/POZ domain-containing protein 6 [Aphelenchus avenae]